jgi:hypothetical protein
MSCLIVIKARRSMRLFGESLLSGQGNNILVIVITLDPNPTMDNPHPRIFHDVNRYGVAFSVICENPFTANDAVENLFNYDDYVFHYCVSPNL